jgi:ATP-dependent 26S proteasome regulatory subunit
VSGLDQNQTFLYILESLKTMEHKTTVMMTVNDIKKLNAAMLRPGRVDEIIQFKEPDELQRLDFIRRLLTEKLGEPNPNQEHIEKLAKAVKGMTQAYIKEWVEFYLVEEKDIDKVLAAISQRKKIMKSANISFDEDMD